MGVGCAQDQADAVRYFRAAARKSQAGAMFLLGQCYTFGHGVTQDAETGMGWYRRAATLGSREAEFELGECFAHGVAGATDLSSALQWWRVAARHGHGRAQIKVGHCYRWGDGVRQNKATALGWYQRALAGGEVGAAVWIGECLEQGEGVPQDYAAAAAMYRRAATAGEPHGMAELGRCLLHGVGVRSHRGHGEKWLRKAAELGWDTALGELQRYWFDRAEALMAANQADASGVREAASLYLRAAELGHSPAALRYAQCLRAGRGVERNLSSAMQWFGKASAQLDAKIALADMLYFGEAGEPRPEDAFRWYLLAAEQGDDAYAMYSAGYCLLHGIGTPCNVAAALRWMEEAARRGDRDAQYELGCAYGSNQWGVLDQVRALKWLTSAAQLGHDGAQVFLSAAQADSVGSLP